MSDEEHVMTPSNDLILLGASVRSAAWSALRAGFRPWCVDLFADVDLRRVAQARQIAREDYPRRLPGLLADAPAGPWMYTGALENHRGMIERIGQRRALWGNGRAVLRRVRSPFVLAELLRSADIPCPAVAKSAPVWDDHRCWLIKPYRSGGGRGIHFTSPRTAVRELPACSHYFQEWIEGESYSALYLGQADDTTQLLGVTQQLVGETWLRAGPFSYSGSIGPLSLTQSQHGQYQRLGNVLAHGFSLRGLFGVDCIERDGVVCPVEVNPRYTASAEIIELALQTPLLASHAAVFHAPNGERVITPSPPGTPGGEGWGEGGAASLAKKNSFCKDPAQALLQYHANIARRAVPLHPDPLPPEYRGERGKLVPILGKSILHADRAMEFPKTGPWTQSLKQPWEPWIMPEFADIPHAGQSFLAGEPILTMFVTGDSADECRKKLRIHKESLAKCGL